MALKVFKTYVVKSIPYKDDPCPDIQHYKDLTAAGYTTVDLMHEEPIGDHVVRGNFFCYAKYRDLYTVLRTYPRNVLESHFKGGTDIRSRAYNHFRFFKSRHDETGNDDYLYCIAGMAEGLTCPLTHKSKDLNDTEMRVPVGEGTGKLLAWYSRQKKVMI